MSSEKAAAAAASPTSASNIFSNLSLRVQSVQRPDVRFLNLQNYTVKFKEQLIAVERTCRKLSQRQHDLAADLAELGSVFRAFSMSEKELQPALQKIESTVDELFLTLRFMVNATEGDFLDPLQEYLHFPEALRSVLRAHEVQMIQLEHAMDALQAKRDALKALDNPAGAEGGIAKSVGSAFSSLTKMLDKDPEGTARRKRAELEAAVRQLETDTEAANSELIKNSELVLHEIQRFHKEKGALFSGAGRGGHVACDSRDTHSARSQADAADVRTAADHFL